MDVAINSNAFGKPQMWPWPAREGAPMGPAPQLSLWSSPRDLFLHCSLHGVTLRMHHDPCSPVTQPIHSSNIAAGCKCHRGMVQPCSLMTEEQNKRSDHSSCSSPGHGKLEHQSNCLTFPPCWSKGPGLEDLWKMPIYKSSSFQSASLISI